MAEESVSETLDRNPPSQSPATPLSPSSPTAVDPSLSRSGSFSGLNAKAPEFVPSSPRPQTTQQQQQQQPQQRIAIPPPPPHGVVHVYPPYHGHHPLVPLHHYPSQVPVWFHPQQQQHGQYQSAGGDQEASLNKGGDHHHHQGHNNQNHSYHHHHHRRRQQVQGDQDQAASSNGMSDETVHKVLNQVEYYFSDLNLATTDHLMKYISKDPEGYVPISVVASFKKIKSFVNSSAQLSNILRNSSKLVVSEDGKKIKRLHPLTDSEMEELQSRVVVAENLPEDHCYQNLMKIFSTVGSVKAIRTCQPSAGGGASPANRLGKADGMLYCNKLHAFVEYESVDLAEKAVEELNDEENWRSGLRVRLILRRGGKPVQARMKKGPDGEEVGEEEDASMSEHQPNTRQQSDESLELSDSQIQGPSGDESANDREGGPKRGRGRGRGGRGRGRGQYHQNARGSHPVLPPTANPVANETSLVGKQPPGPRMPDGTRGFSMGRGKPVSVDTADG